MRASLWRVAATVILIVGLAASYGCGKRSVASVNGDRITHDEFYKRLQMNPIAPNVTFPPPIEAQTATAVLNAMITEQLLLDMAKEEGVLPTQDQIDERKRELNGALNDRGGDLATLLARSGMSHQELDKRLMPELAQTNVIAKYVEVTDDEVQQAYDEATAGLPADEKYRSAFFLPEAVRLSVIINEEKSEIDEAKRKLDAGVAFGVVAEEHSADENTRRTKGDLGWMDRPDPLRPARQGVPPEIYERAFQLEKGRNTEPFQAGGAWIIMRAEDKRESRMQPFEHVKGVIRDRLLYQKALANEDLVQKLGPLAGMEGQQRFTLANLRSDAEINVTLPNYKDAFERFQEQLSEQLQALPSVTERAVGAPGAPEAP